MSILTKLIVNVIPIIVAVLEHFGEDAHGRDGHEEFAKYSALKN
jgi:hypothetical protein